MVVGEPAWHRLGTVLDRPATAEQAIKAAHLDWSVTKQPVFIGKPGLFGESHRYLDSYAIVRDDDWRNRKLTALGFAAEDYTPLQNREAFSFFDPIVGQNAAIYHTAGALGDGELIWILAKLPDCIRVVGDDITEKYLLLSNSHGGSGAVEIKFTPIRVVCQNTLALAMLEGPSFHIAHTKDVKERLMIAANILSAVNARYGEIECVFKEMASVQLGKRELQWYLHQVFPDPNRADFGHEDSYEQALQSARTDRAAAEYFFREGKGNEQRGVEGTLWAAYNGVAEYVDHYKYAKASTHRHLQAIWFGMGSSIKEHAYTVAAASLTGLRKADSSLWQEPLANVG
jgi:phage/plasmid-like protein (TIGR03299 family)